LNGLEKRFIGHLQSNKVNKAIDLFDTIDSVDSLKVASRIGSRCEYSQKEMSVLLEVNTSEEKTKSGFSPENIELMLACIEVSGISVKGLMTIGPRTTNENKIRKAFQSLNLLMENINDQISPDTDPLIELSMGMSNDYEIAVEEGATQVRLGTALFGPRAPRADN